ncbi:MAG: hypothetical protein JXR25_15155 [Pontiellaceae bacterium]|nr:hypothetical protein [Pontiellaceae bacterium]
MDLIAGAQKRNALRKAGKRTARRLRIATLRRYLFTLSEHVAVHAHKAAVTLTGGGADNLRWFKECRDTLSIC